MPPSLLLDITLAPFGCPEERAREHDPSAADSYGFRGIEGTPFGAKGRAGGSNTRPTASVVDQRAEQSRTHAGSQESSGGQIRRCSLGPCPLMLYSLRSMKHVDHAGQDSAAVASIRALGALVTQISRPWAALMVVAAVASTLHLNVSEKHDLSGSVAVSALTVALLALIWLPSLLRVLGVAGGGVKLRLVKRRRQASRGCSTRLIRKQSARRSLSFSRRLRRQGCWLIPRSALKARH